MSIIVSLELIHGRYEILCAELAITCGFSFPNRSPRELGRLHDALNTRFNRNFIEWSLYEGTNHRQFNSTPSLFKAIAEIIGIALNVLYQDTHLTQVTHVGTFLQNIGQRKVFYLSEFLRANPVYNDSQSFLIDLVFNADFSTYDITVFSLT